MSFKIKQMKTNMLDSTRCVKFTCSSFVVAPPNFFDKYASTSFMTRQAVMKENSRVIMCLPQEDGPDGWKCRVIRPSEISEKAEIWEKAQAIEQKKEEEAAAAKKKAAEEKKKKKAAPAKKSKKSKGSGPMGTSDLKGKKE
jgi:hypothetical protein